MRERVRPKINKRIEQFLDTGTEKDTERPFAVNLDQHPHLRHPEYPNGDASYFVGEDGVYCTINGVRYIRIPRASNDIDSFIGGQWEID